MDISRHWSDLLDRYKSGNISDADRYILERAALDDPFLFDALEGYSTIGRSTAEKQGAKIFSLRNIAVAVSMVGLIAVIGYLRTTSSDSALIVSEDTATETPEIPNSEPIAMKTEIEAPNVELVEKQGAKPIQEAPKVLQKASKPMARKMDLQSEEIVANQSVVVVERKQEIISTTSKPETPHVRESKPIIADIEAPATSYGIASDPLFSEKSQKKMTLHASINPFAHKVTPSNGWEAFAKVVEQQKGPKRLKPVVVVVSFDVDTDGNISKISTDDTFCTSCAEKAKEIIRSSSPWTNHSGKPEQITYTISF